MIQMAKRIPVFVALMTLPIVASAYDAETHALIADRAFFKSVLSPTSPQDVVKRLGFDRLSSDYPFSAYWLAGGGIAPSLYYDNDSNYAPYQFPRYPNNYEACEMQSLADAGYLTTSGILDGDEVTYRPIEEWIIRGDLREDDVSSWAYFFQSQCGTPDRDPWLASDNEFEMFRVVNHFYDPIHDVAFSGGPGGTFCLELGDPATGQCYKSIDWAMGYVDSFSSNPTLNDSRPNHFTYEDARQNMWLALTGERDVGTPDYTAGQRAANAAERTYRWATTFRALGDVIHLLQDGAQPQHVRNDDHGPLTTGERQAYEGYTNARVVGPTRAAVQDIVRDYFAASGVTLALQPIVTGDYPVVKFSTPQKFFTTRQQDDLPTASPDSRRGLIDYTNRGFFTDGTMPSVVSAFTGATFPEPVPIDSSYTSITVPCVLGAELSVKLPYLKCQHLMHPVADSIFPGYQDEMPHNGLDPSPYSEPPILQFSIWEHVAPNSPLLRPHAGFAIGLDEYQATANLTIPRAIGYSAGLINFFFRGSIEVDAPTDGLIAIVDDSTPHHPDGTNGYPICDTTVAPINTQGPAVCSAGGIYGFTAVRLGIRNSTGFDTIIGDGSGNIVESGANGTDGPVPQSMASTRATKQNGFGQIFAVARYHRNACYQSNLSSEKYVDGTDPLNPVYPNCNTITNRTNYQEISVSASLVVDASVLNASSAQLQTFDFSADPIPINATDLFLQVVYRGPLGDEPDGIAIGTMDVSEPTYISFNNSTDFVRTPAGYESEVQAQASNYLPSCPPPTGGYYEASPTYELALYLNGYKIFERVPQGENPDPDSYQIPVGGLARVAFLSSIYPQSVDAIAVDGSCLDSTYSNRLAAFTHQTSMEDGSGSGDWFALDKERNLVVGYYDYTDVVNVPSGFTPQTVVPIVGDGLSSTIYPATTIYFPGVQD